MKTYVGFEQLNNEGHILVHEFDYEPHNEEKGNSLLEQRFIHPVDLLITANKSNRSSGKAFVVEGVSPSVIEVKFVKHLDNYPDTTFKHSSAESFSDFVALINTVNKPEEIVELILVDSAYEAYQQTMQDMMTQFSAMHATTFGDNFINAFTGIVLNKELMSYSKAETDSKKDSAYFDFSKEPMFFINEVTSLMNKFARTLAPIVYQELKFIAPCKAAVIAWLLFVEHDDPRIACYSKLQEDIQQTDENWDEMVQLIADRRNDFRLKSLSSMDSVEPEINAEVNETPAVEALKEASFEDMPSPSELASKTEESASTVVADANPKQLELAVDAV